MFGSRRSVPRNVGWYVWAQGQSCSQCGYFTCSSESFPSLCGTKDSLEKSMDDFQVHFWKKGNVAMCCYIQCTMFATNVLCITIFWAY